MSDIGTWDAEMFESWRRAAGERKRMLLGKLIEQNTPLLKLLTGQLRGDDGPDTGRRRRHIVNAMRVPGSEDIEWDEALNIARLAFCDALKSFDPTKGRISAWAKFRIRYELQRAVEVLRDIKLPRAAAPELRPKGYLSIDIDEDGKGENAEAMASIEAALTAPELEEPSLLQADDEVNHHSPPEPREPEPFRPPPREHRDLVDRFVLGSCVFEPRARVPRATLLGAFDALGWELGLWPDRKPLCDELALRGVKSGAVTLQLDFARTRVASFVGVRLAA